MRRHPEFTVAIQPTESLKDGFPVVSLDLGTGGAAEKWELQRPGVGDVRRKVDEVLAGPPPTDARPEIIAASCRGGAACGAAKPALAGPPLTRRSLTAHTSGTRTCMSEPPSDVMNDPKGEKRM